MQVHFAGMPRVLNVRRYGAGERSSVIESESASRRTPPPRYESTHDEGTDEENSEPDLRRLTLDWNHLGSRAGSVLRAKLVISIDFGTT